MEMNKDNGPEETCTICCQSCGMPMSSESDYGGDTGNVYCVHCCQPDGSLKRYNEVYEGMVTLFMKTRNLDRTSAKRAAKDYLASMPAWARE